ncbi:MAG: cyclic nucleotide-binding domain-containing protein [Polycyclovorans sp.]|nr:cyclic nucleotide-binding domain-containing protein [Polycyclovorans sp.]
MTLFDSPAMQAFLQQARKRSVPAKRTLLRSGQCPTEVMLVLEGSLSVALEAPDGREVVLGYLNPGEFCGEACLFPDHHLPNTVIRTRRVTLIAEMGAEQFRSFCAEHPETLFEISRHLASKVFDCGQRIADLALLKVSSRVARTLENLGSSPDATLTPQGEVSVCISRQELARHVGCSREMAGRVVKQLEADGVLRAEGRMLILSDHAAANTTAQTATATAA